MLTKKSKYLLLFFLLLYLTVSQSVFAQKLHLRELTLFSKNFELKYKCIFENDKAFLIVSAPAYNYRLGLKVYADYTSKSNLVWQSEPEFRDSISETVHKVPLDLELSNFALEIKVVNSNKQLLYHDIAYVSASDISTQLYIIGSDGLPLLRNYLKEDDFFKISHNKSSVLNFSVAYYGEEAMPAPPPASKNNGFFNPQNQVVSQNFTVLRGRELKLSEKGIFYIQTDSSATDGIYISYFGEDFPALSNVNELVLATRYITKNEEYDKMNSASNMKAALDEYWLSRNKNEQEAKRLISLYYNRMKEANRFFTFVKQGWKTDMGMIYTVFGKPQIVRKYNDKTIWYYSHAAGRDPVEFVFICYKDQYLLDRSGSLKEPWNAEIMKWRLGRAN
jgi:GWxTD domain-containing protein